MPFEIYCYGCGKEIEPRYVVSTRLDAWTKVPLCVGRRLGANVSYRSQPRQSCLVAALLKQYEKVETPTCLVCGSLDQLDRRRLCLSCGDTVSKVQKWKEAAEDMEAELRQSLSDTVYTNLRRIVFGSFGTSTRSDRELPQELRELGKNVKEALQLERHIGKLEGYKHGTSVLFQLASGDMTESEAQKIEGKLKSDVESGKKFLRAGIGEPTKE